MVFPPSVISRSSLPFPFDNKMRLWFRDALVLNVMSSFASTSPSAEGMSEEEFHRYNAGRRISVGYVRLFFSSNVHAGKS